MSDGTGELVCALRGEAHVLEHMVGEFHLVDALFRQGGEDVTAGCVCVPQDQVRCGSELFDGFGTGFGSGRGGGGVVCACVVDAVEKLFGREAGGFEVAGPGRDGFGADFREPQIEGLEVVQDCAGGVEVVAGGHAVAVQS
ncbi:hypothetical protein ACWIGI_28555 [Nocardia sp. NPDC055321]